jgi:hypothetical protein
VIEMSWQDIIKNDEQYEDVHIAIFEPIKALYDKLKMRSNTLRNMNEEVAEEELAYVITELIDMERTIRLQVRKAMAGR